MRIYVHGNYGDIICAVVLDCVMFRDATNNYFHHQLSYQFFSQLIIWFEIVEKSKLLQKYLEAQKSKDRRVNYDRKAKQIIIIMTRNQ